MPDAYRYNPYVNYYQQMDRAWAPERDARRSSPRREKRVTFPEEWPEESDLYGWAQQGRRSEMKLREYEREEQRVERRGGSESPLNRSRSAPPDKKERSAGGFMDGFGSGNRGRDEEKRRREDYAKELKEQIRNKQIKQSVDIGDKRVSRSRPPTPLSQTLYESPPTKQQPLSQIRWTIINQLCVLEMEPNRPSPLSLHRQTLTTRLLLLDRGFNRDNTLTYFEWRLGCF